MARKETEIRTLSENEVAFYRENGYVVAENVLTEAQIADARRETEDIVEGAAAVAENDAVYDLEDGHTPERPRLRRIKAPDRVHPFFWELVRAPNLVALVSGLLGPDIQLLGSKVNMKAAGFGASVEWHQDWAFYPHTNDDLLAAGVMLDDMTEENGALMVMPGTHRGPIFDHHNEGVFCGALDAEASGLDFSSAVKLTAPAGSVSLHHVRLVHGSALNRSGHGRRLLCYEMTAADAWPLAGVLGAYEATGRFDYRTVAGEPCLSPRLRPVPVRIPLPRPADMSSIYQMQKGMAERFFEVHREEAQAAS